MPLGFFRKKNKEPVVVAQEEQSERNKVNELLSAVDDYSRLTKSFSEAKNEYDVVTRYLSDCEKIAALSGDELRVLKNTAEKIDSLNKTRDEYMNRQRGISDERIMFFDINEAVIPDAIKRLKEDEKYQDTLKRDMSYLEGEKLRWVMSRNDSIGEMGKLRIATFIVLGIFAVSMIAMMIMYLGYKSDIPLWLVIITFSSVFAGFFILIRYQNDIINGKVAKKNADKAISMLNRVKIKYVNITNAVEYEKENYQVRDSRDFNLQWEAYQQAVRERERFKDANSDLEMYAKRLLGLLASLELYDSQIWLDMPSVLYRTGDMVERRHELFTRRQKLRNKLNSYIEAITFQKKDIKRLMVKYPEYKNEVEDILYMADKLIVSGKE